MRLKTISMAVLVSFVFSILLFVAPLETSNAAALEILYGDVNSDGKVNSIDYSYLRRYILGIYTDFSAPQGKEAADVNRSGSINSTDYALFSKYLLGFITEFPDGDMVYKNPNASVEDRVKDLIARMTIEEKIGQMIQGERKNVTNEDVSTYFLGSVLSGGGSSPLDNTANGWMEMISEYQNAAQSTRLGIPILYGTDAVHGHNNVYGATIFPHNIALGAIADPELMTEIGKVTAEEVIASGVNWNFGPCIAVARDERWGRTYESYSENPDLVSQLAVPFMKAMQEYGLTSTAKHFVADGGTTGGIDQGDAIISEDELRSIHLPAYKEMIDNGVKTVMASFSSFNGVKHHENKYLLTDVLKGELGFDGFVVSDWEAILQLSGATFHEQVVDCVNAGVDMLMEPVQWLECIDILKLAVANGEVTEERIDDAVSRILKVKFEMDVFERPFGNQELVTSEHGAQEHRDLARKAVRESIVLLKNQDNILPLKKNANIFITGPASDSIGIQCGGWTITWRGGYDLSSKLTPGTTIMEGFEKIANENGGKIITSSIDAQTEADVAVVVLGELPYAEGFGDCEDLSLNGENMLYDNTEALRKARETGLPIVIILVSGRPRVITEELDGWAAFVEAWLPGTEGDGIAEVMYGDYNFKGKLPLVWPSTTEQLPINADDMGDKLPLFPYGYGLTYE